MYHPSLSATTSTPPPGIGASSPSAAEVRYQRLAAAVAGLLRRDSEGYGMARLSDDMDEVRVILRADGFRL